MDFMPIMMIIMAIAALIAILLHISKRRAIISIDNIINTANLYSLDQAQGSNITISLMQLPVTAEFDEKRLYEITDTTILSRIMQTIPSVSQIVGNTTVKNITKKVLNNPNVVLLKIPPGTTLANPTKKGIQYAIYRGPKSGFAQVAKPDLSKMTKAATLANGVTNVMNISSLVVGQYYMSEINSKLESMRKMLDEVRDFQEREFKGRSLSLLTRIDEISQFSIEIIENDDLRKIKLSTLEDLKGISTELLGQVNIAINDIAINRPELKYPEYQKAVEDISILLD